MALPTRPQPWPDDSIFDASVGGSPRPVMHDPGSGASTLDELLSEFTDRWSRGQEPRAEAFLSRLASGEADDAVELIYHEFCLAEADGRAPDPAVYLQRFPRHVERLGRLLGLHEAIDPARLRVWAEPAELPASGDELGPYRLLRELGRGGLARVFLAEQSDLADRLVVVKVSARASVEPQLLARARHPHIVEVLRHGEADGGALHFVCMPFLGGATLSKVLEEAFARGRRPRSGRALLGALDRTSAKEFGPPGSSPARELLGRASYPKAVAWLLARLADALEKAQRRGVSHGDIKPSNVLLAADGRPMLLDFNLSIDWRSEDDGRPGGGTLAYMAPERLRALADPEGQPRPRPEARHRADLYALGLLLREALTGEPPRVPEGPAPDRARLATRLAESREALAGSRLATHRAIPSGLRPLLAKLLAPDPADRYAHARDLAEDLDRWREDRPTRFADEPGRASRLARWARRQRLALAAGALVGLGGAAVGFAAFGALEGSKREVAQAKLDRVWGGGEPGVFRFRGSGRWSVAEHDDPAALASQHLARYGLAGPEADGRAWRDRDDVRPLPENDRDDLELWLLEQTWRLARALRDRPESPEDWRRAVSALDRVPEWAALRPFRALRADLVAAIRDAGGPTAGLDVPSSSSPPPAPAWVAAYLDGLEAEALHAEEAEAFYDRVLDDRPESFWAHYRAAAAGCRMVGGWPEALDDLRACLKRHPENPALLTQMASGLMKVERFDEARDALERSLTYHPDFREAYRTRAILDLRQGRPGAYGSDSERYARLAGPLASLSRWEMAMRPRLADEWNGQAEPTRLEAAPQFEDAEPYVLFAFRLEKENRLVEALAAFDEALRIEPEHLPARLRRARLLRRLERPEAGTEFLAVVANPRFEELLRQEPNALRALHIVADQRLDAGQAAEALEPANRALTLGLRYRLLIGESHYRLARVHAELARSDARHLEPVVAQLRAARACHPDFVEKWLPRDPRFHPIRSLILPALQDGRGGEPPVVLQ